MAITLTINGQDRSLEVEADMPLLWALRDTLGLTGTKFGCGIAACGACTVHSERPRRPLVHAAGFAIDGRAMTTIEGLAAEGALTRCSRRGSSTRCRSAATASRE